MPETGKPTPTPAPTGKLPDGRGIPIRLTYPAVFEGKVSDRAVVSHTDYGFAITFFEDLVPVFIGTDDEKRAQLHSIEFVESRCVARIHLTPQKAKELRDAMITNIDIFEKKSSPSK